MKNSHLRRHRNTDLSRRRFLQLSAMAAGSAALGACAQSTATTKPAGQRSSSDKLNVALVGCGRQGIGDMKALLGCAANVIALCDVDEAAIATARKAGGLATAHAHGYSDYRHLLDSEKTLDAVLIGTPDHWHAPLCRFFMQAGKHVYCEKPLTRTVGEARALRELVKTTNVVTQLGNQGSAAASMRRCVELLRAGVLGQVHDIHVWIGGGTWPHSMERPPGADPVPPGLNWDFWVGPSPQRPYKKDIYHPYNWRGWYDFGTGQVGNFACHALNLPLRGLDLDYPEKIELLTRPTNIETYAKANRLRLHFAARQQRGPVVVHWYDGGPTPAPEIVQDVTALFGKPQEQGVLLIGDKGIMYTDVWNKGGLIKLTGEPRLKDVLWHAATRNIPVTLPRVRAHMDEWVSACRGGPPTFSDFEIGGHLTEIALAAVVAMRLGHSIAWDGPNMLVRGAPDAAQYVQPPWRKEWIG